jgi:hypothetical protein
VVAHRVRRLGGGGAQAGARQSGPGRGRGGRAAGFEKLTSAKIGHVCLLVVVVGHDETAMDMPQK